MIRPITLWPFPEKEFKNNNNCKMYISIEMSMGQMIDDIKLACECKVPVKFFGKAGGIVPTSHEIIEHIKELQADVVKQNGDTFCKHRHSFIWHINKSDCKNQKQTDNQIFFPISKQFLWYSFC